MGLHKIWALESKIVVPITSIIRAHQEPGNFTFWKVFRLPETEIPGLIAAGTFYKKDRNFWDVMNKKSVVMVELKDHYFKKLIIELQKPEEILHLLNTK